METLRKELAHPRYELIPTADVEKQLEYLPVGATVTVTCSPTRGVGPTLDLAEKVAGRGYEVVPHISARLVEGEGHLEEVLGRISGAGILQAFVIGGDVSEPVGLYRGALDLLTAIRERDGALELGASGYPEGHPYMDDETLMGDLLEKQHYVGYITTQLCLDARKILEWTSRVRERGMTLPIRTGLPGILDRKKLLELSFKIGVGESTRFLKKNTSMAARLALPGGYEPTGLVRELAGHLGDPYYNLTGFHIYTFNHLQRTEEWRKRLLQREELSTGEMQGANT